MSEELWPGELNTTYRKNDENLCNPRAHQYWDKAFFSLKEDLDGCNEYVARAWVGEGNDVSAVVNNNASYRPADTNFDLSVRL